jgi:hypothetical protein
MDHQYQRESTRICAILLQDVMKRGVYQCGGGDALREAHSAILTSVACLVGPSVTRSSTDFSFQNLGFWNLFEFSATQIT